METPTELPVKQIEQTDLLHFLQQWDESYKTELNKINLFNQDLTSKWDLQKKQFFAKILYHQRSHFDDVLWYMGNFSPDKETKEIILNNIRDEFGGNALSHERLYLEFAKGLGVDLFYELIEENFYLPFLREYNKGHLRWLREHDWDHRLSAFSALERLDNLDYLFLRKIAESFQLTGTCLTFFNVHIHVKHYDEVKKPLQTLWMHKKNIVISTFNFIGEYQLNIWRQLSDVIFKASES